MAVIGKNILENLTTGMYYDSKVIYREYIQNACDQIDKAEKQGLLKKDEGMVDIDIDPRRRCVTITDNATGVSKDLFRSQLGDIANSDKIRGKDKGFRGIGRLCGLAYCKTLTFCTSAKGENIKSIMKIDAKMMREMLASPIKYSVEDILEAITTYDEMSEEAENHFFIVQLQDINRENTDLLDKAKVSEYLSFVAPVPFNNKFRHRAKIHDHAASLGYHIDEYNVFVGGNPIFKEYGMRLYKKNDSGGSKQAYDEIRDVTFHEIYKGKDLVAWMWYGLCRFDGAIPKKENPMYGFRVRQSNIQIGSNTEIARFFKEERGNSYFVGEIYAVHEELTPNSQRDNFNENPIRIYYETELERYCHDVLHKLYNMANNVKKSYTRLMEYSAIVEEYTTKAKEGFIDDHERIELENKLSAAEKKKDEAKKAIEKLPSNSDVGDNPTAIVQRAIKENFDKKNTEKKVLEAERKQSTSSKTTAKSKYFTDSLSKLDKNKRKLIAQVMVIVSKHTDEATLNKIKAEIEKEFR